MILVVLVWVVKDAALIASNRSGSSHEWAASRCLAIAVLGSGLLCAGCDSQHDKTSNEIAVEITGYDYSWQIKYPGPDGQLNTDDDLTTQRFLYLPERSKVKIELNSRDFIYSFTIPEIGLREVAVPGLPMFAEFTTGGPASFDLLGDQFCGFSHENLIGRVYVEDAGEFLGRLQDFGHSGQADAEFPAI